MTGETFVPTIIKNLVPASFNVPQAQMAADTGVVIMDINGQLYPCEGAAGGREAARAPADAVTFADFLLELQRRVVACWEQYPGTHTVRLLLDQRVPALKDVARKGRTTVGPAPPSPPPCTAAGPAGSLAEDIDDAETEGPPDDAAAEAVATLVAAGADLFSQPLGSLRTLMYNGGGRRLVYEAITQSLMSGVYRPSYGSDVQPLLPCSAQLTLDGAVLAGEPLRLPLNLVRDASGAMTLNTMDEQYACDATTFGEADTRIGFWCDHDRAHGRVVIANDIDIVVMLLHQQRQEQAAAPTSPCSPAADGDAARRSSALYYVTMTKNNCYDVEAEDKVTRPVSYDMRRLYWSLDLAMRWPHMNVVDLLTLLVALRGTDYTQKLAGSKVKLDNKNAPANDAVLLARLEAHLYDYHPELDSVGRRAALDEVAQAAMPTARKPVPQQRRELNCPACPPSISQVQLWTTFWSMEPQPRLLHAHTQAADGVRHTLISVQGVQAWCDAAVGGRPSSSHQRRRQVPAAFLRRLCAQAAFYAGYFANARLPHYKQPDGYEQAADGSSLYGWQHTPTGRMPACVADVPVFSATATGSATPSYSAL